jgi:S-layer protein
VIAEMVSVVGSYTGSDPAGLASAALFNNRASAAQFYAEHGGSLPYATSVLAAVTGDAASVIAARALFLGAGTSGTVDVGGFATVTTSSIDDRLVLTNADEAANWTITATGTLPTLFAQPMDFVRTDASGLQDTVPITLTSHGAMEFWGLSLPGIEHLSFANIDTDSSLHENHVVMTQLDGLQSVTVTGNANFRFDALMNNSLRNFDASLASGNIDYMSTCLAGGSIVRGGSGDDWLSTIMSGDTIVGGAGDDNIACAGGAATLTGGSGADNFRWQTYNSNADAVSTITDFAPGQGDRLLFIGSALGGVVDPAFNSSPVVLPGSIASLRDYLDAATHANIPAAGPSLIRWFQFEGDTYVTVDNSSASTFQDGTDGVIRLAGLVDLGTGVAVSYFALGA